MTDVAGSPYRLADPLSKIAHQYAAMVINTRLSFSLMTEMARGYRRHDPRRATLS